MPAEQVTARFLIIDDKKGRRVARERGRKMIGADGLLIKAKSHGEIPAVQPELEALARIGYRLSPELLSAVTARAEE